MFSWRLWRRVRRYDAAHPVYWRANRTDGSRHRWSINYKPLADLRWVALVLLLVALVVQPRLFGYMLFVPVFLMLLLLTAPAWLPLIIFTYGLIQAMTISRTLARENQRATHDLVVLGSSGPLGTDWAITSAILHRGESFNLLHVVMRIVLATACVLLGLAALIALVPLLRTGDTASAELGSAAQLIVEGILLVILFYTGYTQSVVLSALVGLLLPNYAKSQEIVALGAAGTYSALQIGSYTLALLIALDVLPLLSAIWPVESWQAGIGLSLLRFAIVIGIREWIIWTLWNRLIQRLNLDDAEAAL